jgi:hypothetical protein
LQHERVVADERRGGAQRAGQAVAVGQAQLARLEAAQRALEVALERRRTGASGAGTPAPSGGRPAGEPARMTPLVRITPN